MPRPTDLSTPAGLSDWAKRAARKALPPAAVRRIQAVRGRRPPRVVAFEQLDGELEEAAKLFSVSEDAARAFLRGFCMAPPPGRPEDPFSDEYRGWVFDLYATVSGRRGYSLDNEASPFDLEESVARPYPYSTGSTTVVGEELVARGFIVSTLGLAPPARIVEFGSGWGNLTNDLAAMGFEVTAVEVDSQFCALTERRSRTPERLRVVHSGMLEFEATERFDAAIFYESFHHCADHMAMLGRLSDIVGPRGRVLWAGEPIAPMGMPWGLRLDGYSLWSTRTHGWLELGFDERYFAEALDRTGWQGSRRRLPAGSPLADVIVGSR
ncbi:MAG: class I SAM-dependent methyltransferase [Acidimicrobiales bacterium]